ncbi:MAG: OFA family MFS transporter [Acidimicrobiales bacterium]|nr:OFA family MFS transporter [Acidimicrobiales bacterium]RZV45612.1 MAG: MFS transporter [Acidimicrobiales bacterium]
MSHDLRRWPVVLGAVLIQLCLGAIYAWSVFTPALKDDGWSNVQTQFVFSTGLAAFAIVMVLAGKNLKTYGPRAMATVGGVTLGAGYIIASIGGGTSFWPVLLGIGLVGGAGIGLAYVVPIAVGMRWFPDRKGMITGLAVAGFGFGALGWIKIAGSWGNLIDEAGLGTTFLMYGIAFATIVLLGATTMRMPPDGWLPPGFVPPVAAGQGGDEFTPREMIRTPQFHLLSLTFAMSAGAGLMAIGLMKSYPIEALTDSGVSETQASAIAGTAMAVFFSLANGAGRIAWGVLSDKLGRKRSVVTMASTQGLFLLAFIPMAGTEWSLYLAATLIGFNFGGNFALFPALTADEFGNGAVGTNYPWVFLSYGAGGIVFPILGGWLGDLDNFALAFSICGVGCIIGALASAIVYPPHHDEAMDHFSVHGFLHNAHFFDHDDVTPGAKTI